MTRTRTNGTRAKKCLKEQSIQNSTVISSKLAMESQNVSISGRLTKSQHCLNSRLTSHAVGYVSALRFYLEILDRHKHFRDNASDRGVFAPAGAGADAAFNSDERTTG